MPRIVGLVSCVLLLQTACGDRTGLARLTATGSDGGGGQTDSVADAAAADPVDAGTNHVALDANFADDPPGVLGICSTPDAGVCPYEHTIWLPLSGDPAACGLPSQSACLAVCPRNTTGCSVERDAGVNLVGCQCLGTLVK
jgi:hypothetical protein